MLEVYLFRGKHPLYETLVAHPPEGVAYLPAKRAQRTEEYSLYGPSHSMIRVLLDDMFALAGVPRTVPVLRHYDLVHSSRGFIPVGPNKFVVDLEHVSSFAGMHHERMRSQRLRGLIRSRLLSPKCGAVLPHCQAAKRTLSLISPDRALNDKSTVVYPAVDVGAPRRNHSCDSSPNILFMGEYLWKGGREVLDACSSLVGKLDFHLIYISLRVAPPEQVLSKLKASIPMTFINGPVPRRQLMESIYPKCDIFVMPTYIDTFGYAFLEAMAFGIPCIGTRHFAVPEIIEDGVSGKLVDPPKSFFDENGMARPEETPENWRTSVTVAQLTDALSALMQSTPLRRRLGEEGQRSVTQGKFSVARRNEVLRGIYESSARR